MHRRMYVCQFVNAGQLHDLPDVTGRNCDLHLSPVCGSLPDSAHHQADAGAVHKGHTGKIQDQPLWQQLLQ